MDTTYTFNSGSITLESVDERKSLVTLVSRDIDCSNISKEVFVNAIIEDMTKANTLYSDIATKDAEIRLSLHIEAKMAEFWRQAKLKYKRVKNQENYVQKSFNEYISKYNNYIDDLSYVDFKLTPAISISDGCVITIKDLEYKANACYDIVSIDKYFPHIKGWKIVYESFGMLTDTLPSLKYSFRPYFKFIMDEEATKQMEDENRKLVEDVTRFYEGCTYWGD